jgi:hypothetical protein
MVRVEDLDQQMDDEALARALQEEFTRELFISHQQPSSARRPTNSRPVVRGQQRVNSAPAPVASRRVVSRTQSNGSAHGVSVRPQNSTRMTARAPVPRASSSSAPRTSNTTTNNNEYHRSTTARSGNPARQAPPALRIVPDEFPEDEQALSAAWGRVRPTYHSSSAQPDIEVTLRGGGDDYGRRLEDEIDLSRISSDDSSIYTSAQDRDAEMAHELQRAIDLEEAAAARRLAKEKKHQTVVNTPMTSRSSSETSEESVTPNDVEAAAVGNDYKLAKKVEQEERDFQLAREMAETEQRRIAARDARMVTGRAVAAEPKRSCSLRQFFSVLFPTLMVCANSVCERIIDYGL